VNLVRGNSPKTKLGPRLKCSGGPVIGQAENDGGWPACRTVEGCSSLDRIRALWLFEAMPGGAIQGDPNDPTYLRLQGRTPDARKSY